MLRAIRLKLRKCAELCPPQAPYRLAKMFALPLHKTPAYATTYASVYSTVQTRS